MASTRLSLPTLQCLLRNAARFPHRQQQQRRWAQVYNVRFLATARLPQTILDKYRDKLNQKAATEGHASIDDLKAAYADKIQEQRRREAVDLPPSPMEMDQKPVQASTPKTQSEPSSSSSQTSTSNTSTASATSSKSPSSSSSKSGAASKTGIKPLGDILDLEKVAALPEKELTAIWRLRHASNPHLLCAVIPASTYKAMEDLARSSPQFVLPVPHEEQGAEMHFLQWTFDAASKTSTVLFTQLLEFKSRGEFAQPHTTVTHHLDLLEDKGLVLMQGQVMEGRGVRTEHAKWLLMCLQRFYGGWETSGELDGQRMERAEERKKLLEWFTKGDARFSIEKLMEEAERMG